MTAGEFCTRQVVTIHREDTLVEAAQRMRKHHVGTLVVVDEDEKDGQRTPVGVVTDRDLVVRAHRESSKRRAPGGRRRDEQASDYGQGR